MDNAGTLFAAAVAFGVAAGVVAHIFLDVHARGAVIVGWVAFMISFPVLISRYWTR